MDSSHRLSAAERPHQRFKRALQITAAGVVIFAEYHGSYLSAPFWRAWSNGKILTNTVTEQPIATGPRDLELCYGDIPRLRKQFAQDGDTVSPQEPWLQRGIGSFKVGPIFERPQQAGLRIEDPTDSLAFTAPIPDIYDDFYDIPSRLMQSLSYMEDRNIVRSDLPASRNRALDWKRIGAAVRENVEKKLGKRQRAAGGSGLHIQVVKNLNSADNKTRGFGEKIEQAAIASLEQYSESLDTLHVSTRVATEYVNLVSLGAHPKTGPIRGFKWAMGVWFGSTDYDKLIDRPSLDTPESALAMRQVLTLIMALPNPDETLRLKSGFIKGQQRLDDMLPKMVKEGIFTPDEARMIGETKLRHEDLGRKPVLVPHVVPDKSVASLKLELMRKLRFDGRDAEYRLNQCDLTAETTLNADINKAANREMRRMQDPAFATELGLTKGEYGLNPRTAPKVNWALHVAEVMPDGKLATRVSTDTYKGAFDLNRQGKQNTGSTEKLRMYITRNQLAIARLYDKYADKTAAELAQVQVHPKDNLTRWAIGYLTDPANERSKKAMLAAADEMPYSAALGSFFTGGGVIRPGNFDRKQNGRIYSVKECLWQSVNLCSFRQTDDLEENIKWDLLGIDHRIMEPGITDPNVAKLRKHYLHEFADYEGTIFFNRAWRQLKGKTPQEMATTLAAKTSGAPTPLAVVFFEIFPDAPQAEMESFIRSNCKTRCDLSPKNIATIYDRHAPYRMANMAEIIAGNGDRSPAAIIAAYRSLAPQASYQDVRQAMSRLNPAIDPFRDFRKEFDSFRPDTSVTETDRLARLIDRTPKPDTPDRRWHSEAEQLTALYHYRHPGADYHDVRSFILRHTSTKVGGSDFRAEHQRYAGRSYSPATVIHTLSLNDREHLSVRAMHLRVAALRSEKPDIGYDAARLATRNDRIENYSWLMRDKNFAAQNLRIGIMLDKEAWKVVEKFWQTMGYPYELPATLANVLGVGGDNTQSLTSMNAIVANNGMSVQNTSLSRLSFAPHDGNPYRTVVDIGENFKPVRVLDAEVAQHVLHTAEGNVYSENGTGKRLREAFKLSDGTTGTTRGKTGTAADASTADTRGGFYTGSTIFTCPATPGSPPHTAKFAFTIGAYIYNPAPSDRFTSGLAVRGLEHLASSALRPMFDHACGLRPLKAEKSPGLMVFRQPDARQQLFGPAKTAWEPQLGPDYTALPLSSPLLTLPRSQAAETTDQRDVFVLKPASRQALAAR